MDLSALALSTGVVALAEMGDKTQLLSLMLANAPAVWIGQKFTKRMPIKWVHAVAAVTFIAIGIATLIWG